MFTETVILFDEDGHPHKFSETAGSYSDATDMLIEASKVSSCDIFKRWGERRKVELERIRGAPLGK